MDYTTNPSLERAWSFINDTDRHVYLTGKAGTGKTTFLHRVKAEVPKRMAVAAPTGVAAINAQGMTLHSLFQLPFTPHIPGSEQQELRQRKFSRKKQDLLKSLDLLIIDEISMVRADVLDAIDAVLRRFRKNDRPFGGLQLLLIGDLHQLPPVVKPQEWDLLQEHYDTSYFFGSHALQNSEVIRIELDHIYRQDSREFIELLNRVRDNKMDPTVLEKLNSRYIPNFNPDDEEGYITLTTHNKTARQINEQKLQSLPGQTYRHEATVDGDFPEHAYPTDPELALKVDAQVMFVKNDMAGEKRFYNGKIGRITALNDDHITVRCPEDDQEIEVERLTWENRKFELDKKTKAIEESILGTFKQFPLRLAWAITIHKSQGLTFERLVIDAAAAFAHGQVYVALSRCRTFEGVVLRSKLEPGSIRTDQVVQDHTRQIQENEPDEQTLYLHRHRYQCERLHALFAFSELQRLFKAMDHVLRKNGSALAGNVEGTFREIRETTEQKIIKAAKAFQRELERHFGEETLPEENETLQERLKKAGDYFTEQLNACTQALHDLDILTDNQEVKKNINDRKAELEKELHVQKACFKVCAEGFSIHAVNRAATDAALDPTPQERKAKANNRTKVPENIEHRDLFQALLDWRKETCAEAGLPAYRVLSTQAIIDIAQALPTTMDTLKKVKGIGKVKADQYGTLLLDMVQAYCDANDVEKTDLTEALADPDKNPDPTPRKNKKNTKQTSYDLFQQGWSIQDIASERGLALSTIQGHMTHFIGTGDLDVHAFLPEEKVARIAAYFDRSGDPALSKAKAHFGKEADYGELQMVLAHWSQKKRAS